ncbi:MAG: cytochrome c oxidase subunit II [Candidatus Competibacteraceae bacterium]|jgi:cytochrome c oxidase subunit 2|nr:cytochrome c oxidase subunit II [Candidatus Competibacteraceae bacterium]
MLVNFFVRLRSVITISALLLWSACASAAYELNMPVGVTDTSRSVYDLHMLIFWICVLIGLVVFGVMFYSMYHHRKSKGAVAAQFHESTTVEIIWTVVPMLILIGMAIPATQVLIAMEDTSEPDITVKVTGYQWKWGYEYLDEDIQFFSSLSTPREQIANAETKGEHYLLEVDNPLVLPVGKKIRILTTAADVLHAWWVPALGWKRDAIPGFINDSWTVIKEPGTYRGQCAELCGKDHGFMPVVIEAKSEEDYQQWLADMKGEAAQVAAAEAVDREWTQEELMSKGQEVHDGVCASCHQAGGTGVPGAFPPLVAGQVFNAPEPMLQPLREMGFLGPDNTIVMGPVEQHTQIVLKGIPGSAMQAYAEQLSDAEIAAVITYQRNSWGNDTGDVVQPSTIKSAR